jgi:hypothetical protein
MPFVGNADCRGNIVGLGSAPFNQGESAVMTPRSPRRSICSANDRIDPKAALRAAEELPCWRSDDPSTQGETAAQIPKSPRRSICSANDRIDPEAVRHAMAGAQYRQSDEPSNRSENTYSVPKSPRRSICSANDRIDPHAALRVMADFRFCLLEDASNQSENIAKLPKSPRRSMCSSVSRIDPQAAYRVRKDARRWQSDCGEYTPHWREAPSRDPEVDRQTCAKHYWSDENFFPPPIDDWRSTLGAFLKDTHFQLTWYGEEITATM